MSDKTAKSLLDTGIDSIEQVEFYRVLVDSIQDYAIFLLDTEGCIASWNQGAEQLKGYSPNEIIGKHFSVFYSDKDVDDGKPEWELTECRRFGHVEDEGWRIKKDGSRFWANVVITALYDRLGEFIGYAKVTRDLTERKNYEDRLRRANQLLERQHAELEALNQAKDEFISLASHQLRTPATGVRQFLGLLMDGYAGEMNELQKDYLKKAYDSNLRQISLVNDLLKVAQIDAGQVNLVKSEVDIAKLVRDVVDEQADRFKDRHQNLTLRGFKKPLLARVDEPKLRMAIENLIDNASKYTPDGGQVKVSLSSAGDRVTLKVSDSGVGIDEEQQHRLFTKFSRIPNSLSDEVGGSGLGLYWVNKIVELHDGLIKVKSKPGKGAEFTMQIPVGGDEDV